MRLLLLGANGFIGNHLTKSVMTETDWQIDAIDIASDRLGAYLQHPRFHFQLGDITRETDWVDEKIAACDVILPLVAIATPALYVQDPLRVFELDFEANLRIIRLAVKHHKRIIFPFHPHNKLIPIHASFCNVKQWRINMPSMFMLIIRRNR